MELAKAPVRRIMKQAGGEIVSGDGVVFMLDKLEDIATEITESALKVTKQAKRKKITKGDLKTALDIAGYS